MGGKTVKRIICGIVLAAFCVTSVVPANAQSVLTLPAAGSMVSLSQAFTPPLIKGVKVYPDNPFRFDFIFDKGQSAGNAPELKDEAARLIKYFLSSLTTPADDLWVNLSPYEKDRIVPDAFGQTEMGRDLLAQDYILKQITASVIYPEGEVGKQYWARIYQTAFSKFGTTDIPFDSFNKVWIMPELASVYENDHNGVAYVVKSRLKVMLEKDYDAASANGADHAALPVKDEGGVLAEDVFRQVIIPVLEKEVNEGQNFARLRQVYSSLILAVWLKKKIKDGILAQVYVDRNKVAGIAIDDPREAEKIWQQYVEAFKKGSFNYIKEEKDPLTDDLIPRKYFSGGFNGSQLSHAMRVSTDASMFPAETLRSLGDIIVCQIKAIDGVVSRQVEKAKYLSGRAGRFEKYFVFRFGAEAVHEALLGNSLSSPREQDGLFQVLFSARKSFADRHAFIQSARDLQSIALAAGSREQAAGIANVTLLSSIGFSQLRNGFSAEEFTRYWPEMIRLGLVSENSAYLYTQLVELRRLFSSEEFDRYWPELVSMGLTSRHNSYLFSKLVQIRKTFSEKEFLQYWPDMVLCGKTFGNAPDVYDGLLAMKKISSPEDFARWWPGLLMLGKAADAEARALLVHGLPAVIRLVKSADDLALIGGDLLSVRDKDIDVFRFLCFEGLEQLKDLISSREDLIKSAQSVLTLHQGTGAGYESAFQSILAVRNEFSENEFARVWPGLIRLAAAAGPRAREFILDKVPAVKRSLSADEFDRLWPDFVKLGEAAGKYVWFKIFFQNFPIVDALRLAPKPIENEDLDPQVTGNLIWQIRLKYLAIDPVFAVAAWEKVKQNLQSGLTPDYKQAADVIYYLHQLFGRREIAEEINALVLKPASSWQEKGPAVADVQALVANAVFTIGTLAGDILTEEDARLLGREIGLQEADNSVFAQGLARVHRYKIMENGGSSGQKRLTDTIVDAFLAAGRNGLDQRVALRNLLGDAEGDQAFDFLKNDVIDKINQ
ncbi:MAG: hypothetical protein HQL22_12680, partial [Candidatus Omnitrophica bacterium]|nr:hypothetical protein [Candidatus Omnitrophota bacterium]